MTQTPARCLRVSFLLVAAFALVAGGRRAAAAPINYGDYEGTTVWYVGVQEESSSDPGESLFAAPTIAGNSLDFTPQAFGTFSSGNNSDVVDSNLQFMVEAKPGYGISSIVFSEAGDMTLAGLAGDAQVTLGAPISVEIAGVNGVPTSISATPAPMLFLPKDDFLLSVEGAGTATWSGSYIVDLGPLLATASITGTVTKVNVSLDNSLSASSQQGTSAFVQKKDFDVTVVSVQRQGVPEPASAAIAMLALAAGVAMLRR